MVEIRIRNNDLEKALKVLKRVIQKDGLLKDLREKRFFEKPSDRKRRKERESIKRRLRKAKRRHQARKSKGP
jgi:small subunit ribosomal protein S21